ncbi:hypothetical protein JCGZ_05884 [Jatropha curcas]|uniref:LysM domain-containing protein n=1 Tax=Jatropha curcas TaxID=180498 RepID=A0A067JJG1_JATCU|nr:hypothetical protein JCGZ_05884 [Jatropha curcas]
MKYRIQFPLISLLFIIILTNFLHKTHTKSVIEPCSSSDSCLSLLSYILPFDTQIPEIAFRFKVNISDILAANSINPTAPSITNLIFHSKSFFKIPISCPCVDGIRRSLSTAYIVRAADTIDSIAEGFGGLVSAEQIISTNEINEKNPLVNGQPLVIPLPCTCFNNSNNGVEAVYMSYVVQKGESLERLAMEFGSTVRDLETVNGLVQDLIDPGDILAIPIPACSSANLEWRNESLIVPNGSYALTANNCVKCICLPNNLSLQCLASGVGTKCSHLQCRGSNLFIGQTYIKHTDTSCNVSACVYRGHCGGKIYKSLVTSSNVLCPGKAMSPLASPSFNDPLAPSIALPPLISPSSAPYPTPWNDNNFNISGDGYLLISQVSLHYLLPFHILIYCFFFL